MKGKGRNAKPGQSFHSVIARAGASRAHVVGEPTLGPPRPGMYAVWKQRSQNRLSPTTLWHPEQIMAPQLLHLVTALTPGWKAHVATIRAPTGPPAAATGAARAGRDGCAGAPCGAGGAGSALEASSGSRLCSSAWAHVSQ